MLFIAVPNLFDIRFALPPYTKMYPSIIANGDAITVKYGFPSVKKVKANVNNIYPPNKTIKAHSLPITKYAKTSCSVNIDTKNSYRSCNCTHNFFILNFTLCIKKSNHYHYALSLRTD